MSPIITDRNNTHTPPCRDFSPCSATPWKFPLSDLCKLIFIVAWGSLHLLLARTRAGVLQTGKDLIQYMCRRCRPAQKRFVAFCSASSQWGWGACRRARAALGADKVHPYVVSLRGHRFMLFRRWRREEGWFAVPSVASANGTYFGFNRCARVSVTCRLDGNCSWAGSYAMFW